MKTIELQYKEQIQKGTKVLFWKFTEPYTMTGETDDLGNIEVVDQYGNKSFKLKSELRVIVPYSDLNHYEIGDNVQVLVRNHRTGKDEFRDGTVLSKSVIEPAYGQRHKPYPILFVRTMFTYWSNERQEFYEKENLTGVIYVNEIKIK